MMECSGIRLEPLARNHLAELRARCHDPRLWQYTFTKSPFSDEASSNAWLDAALGDPAMMPFAIVDLSTSETIGSTRLFDIDPVHRKCEIGWTFLAVPWWRTHANTACKYMLLTYAFEEWGARRVQFKAEAINLRSRRAIERLGAVHEGTLRKFRITAGGEVRDTSFYSIVDSEWPAIKARLTSSLDQSRDSLAAV